MAIPLSILRPPSKREIERNPVLKSKYRRRYKSLHANMRMLEQNGIVECREPEPLPYGKRRPFSAYRITLLGKIVYRTVRRAGLYNQRIHLSRIRERLEAALADEPGWGEIG